MTASGNLVYANFVLWGIIDLIIALHRALCGRRPPARGGFGLAVAYLFAGLGAIRWLFVIPAAPILSVVVIVLCVMVIYALARTPTTLESA